CPCSRRERRGRGFRAGIVGRHAGRLGGRSREPRRIGTTSGLASTVISTDFANVSLLSPGAAHKPVNLRHSVDNV
ncbi:hypothetical protein, partial [Burkholderia gladioli]|uniref:hypothetical protein n=1 Tax=Burkholderia gladioli TaxID=28095 RepID=UPI0019D6C39B